MYIFVFQEIVHTNHLMFISFICFIWFMWSYQKNIPLNNTYIENKSAKSPGELEALKLVELKEICKSNSLPVSGTKVGGNFWPPQKKGSGRKSSQLKDDSFWFHVFFYFLMFFLFEWKIFVVDKFTSQVFCRFYVQEWMLGWGTQVGMKPEKGTTGTTAPMNLKNIPKLFSMLAGAAGW